MTSPVLTILTLGALVITPAAFGQGPGRGQQPPAKPFTRTTDGKPDMQGYWETANFFTAFDLETREKEQYGIPAGKGVIVDPADGKIPYQPWAMEKKKDLMEHHLFEDPQAHCYLSGVPRQMYTPFGFQILQPAGNVVLLYEAFHSYRIIPVANKPHIPDSMRVCIMESGTRKRTLTDSSPGSVIMTIRSTMSVNNALRSGCA